MKTGIELIAEERQEQLRKHKYDNAHDQQHRFGELAKVAATLAVLGTDARVSDPDGFDSLSNPWGLPEKLRYDDQIIHRLSIAGALIAAEIDRFISIK